VKRYLKEIIAALSMPVISRVHRLKDIHRGESCYLFGDGISVKWFDLEAFNDRIGLCCNFFPFHNDFYKLDVCYATVTEPWWFLPFERMLFNEKKSFIFNPRQKLYRQIIADNPDKTFLINLSNYPLVRSPNIIYTYMHFHDERLPDEFITRRINAYHGSIRFLVTLAIYMGFECCHMIGFDYTHSPYRIHHWYEKGEGLTFPAIFHEQEFFKIASEFINLTAVTLDSDSKLMPSITYKDLTGREPKYRENTELLGSQYQKAMAAWPDYTIF